MKPMKSKTLKKLYGIHSWVGLITGILLFVIAVTGSISVFGRPELKIWSNPDARGVINMDSSKIERLVNEYAQTVPEDFREEVIVYLPNSRIFSNLAVLYENHLEEQGILLTFDNHDHSLISRREGKLLDLFLNRPSDMADFIVDFHADLHLGRPIGYLLTGLLGLTLMASIVTGVIIHRKIIANLFTFRLPRNSSRKSRDKQQLNQQSSFDVTLADSHKLFGIWGLLFNGIIGFSGAFLGLATIILVPAAAFVAFEGDQEALIETFTTMKEPEISQIYAPTQIATTLENARKHHVAMDVSIVTIMGFNDKNAVIYANAVGGPAVASQIMEFEGHSGKLVDVYGNFEKVEGVSGKILDLMYPLHFGNFGGVAVKVLWAFLGLTTALLPLSGMMMWIERGQRAKHPKHAPHTYDRFNKLVIGSCGGIVLACAALFPAQLVLVQAYHHTEMNFQLGVVFFSVWALSMVLPFVLPRVAPLMAQNTRFTASLLSYVTGAVLVSVLPMNIMLTDSRIWQLASQQHYVTAGVDVVLFVLGALTIFITNSVNNRLKKEYAVKTQINNYADSGSQITGKEPDIVASDSQHAEDAMLSNKVTVEQK